MNEQNIPSNIKAAIRLVVAAIRRIQEKQAAVTQQTKQNMATQS